MAPNSSVGGIAEKLNMISEVFGNVTLFAGHIGAAYISNMLALAT